jgi:hypothetical protein
MVAYTIRVEFEGKPSPQKFEALHQSLAEEGFVRAINGYRSEAPVTVNLPSGLYYGYSGQTALEIADDVYATACGIHPVAAIFVVETATWASK